MPIHQLPPPRVPGRRPGTTDTAQGRKRVADDAPLWGYCFDRERLKQPGGFLIAAVYGRMAQLGLSEHVAIRDYLGFSVGYVTLIATGKRRAAEASDAFLDAVSVFLGVPRMAVDIFAARVEPEKFVALQALLPHEVPRAIRYINEDIDWGIRFGVTFDSLSLGQQFALVRMYEALTGKKLIQEEFQLKEFITVHWPALNNARDALLNDSVGPDRT